MANAMHNKNLKSNCFIIAILSLLVLTACDHKDKTKSASQVIVKVNSEEVSVHQLNFALTHTPGITQENAESAKKQLLDALIDQTLLVQQAMNDKMDRDPQVMLAIEQAKRQVLAQAWLEKSTRITSKPTQEQIEQYYQAHPELFSNRKIYKLKELLVTVTPDKQALLDHILADSKLIDELPPKLDANKISYQVNLTTQAAENLPLENLPALQKLQGGQFLRIDKTPQILVMGVLGSIDEPVERQKAGMIIETFLVNSQVKTNAQNVLKQLKEKAVIEKVGEVLSNAPESNDPAVTAPNPVAPQTTETAIEKGLKGL